MQGGKKSTYLLSPPILWAKDEFMPILWAKDEFMTQVVKYGVGKLTSSLQGTILDVYSSFKSRFTTKFCFHFINEFLCRT